MGSFSILRYYFIGYSFYMNLILVLYIECVVSCKIYFVGDINSVRSYGFFLVFFIV